MKNSVKLIVYLLIVIQLFWPLSTFAEIRATDDGYVSELDNEVEVADEGDEVEPVAEDEIEPSKETEAEDLEGETEGFSSSDAGDVETLSVGQIPDETPSRFLTENTKRVILNGNDERKLKQIATANSVLPNLDTDYSELAVLAQKSIDELHELKGRDPKAYLKLVEEQKKKTSSNDYIKDRLLANPAKLAEFLGVEVGEVVERLESEKDFLSKEILYELENTIDRRVIKTLAYLITPKNRGGAGHYRIKVERITKNYDSERKKGEREDLAIREGKGDGGMAEKSKKDKAKATIESLKADERTIDRMFDPTDGIAKNLVQNSNAIVDVINAEGETTASVLIGKNELEPETVSAHFTGQAVDISEIDDIKCTLIEKRRVGGDKKTPKPPQAIKLLYQTQGGYSSDKDKVDASYNEMFLSASQSALENMFASLNLDATDISNQEINNFSDIAEAIGKSIFGTAIDAPLKDIWNNNLDDMLRMTGGASLADKLGLPREPFLDGTIDSTEELAESIGRSYLERSLNLSYGALKGETRDQILTNIGLSRIATELRLPADTFTKGMDGVTNMNNRIGSRIIEWEFGFPEGSFFGQDNLQNLINAAGRNRIDSFFRDPDFIDGKLGLGKDTTKKLRNGQMSIKDYVNKVAAARLLRSAYAYPNYSGGAGCTTNISPMGVQFSQQECTTNQATVSGNKSNWRDEMMNLPEGTIDSFLSSGNLSSITDKLKDAGILALVKGLEKSDKGMNRLTKWLKNPTNDFAVVIPGDNQTEDKACLPISVYAGKLRIKPADIYKIFGKGEESRGIYKRLGKSLLSFALKPDGNELKMEKEAVNALPNINLPAKPDEFYKNKTSALASSIEKTKKSLLDLKSGLESVNNEDAQATANTLKSAIESKTAQLESSVRALEGKEAGREIMDLNVNLLKDYYTLSSTLTDSSKFAVKQQNNLERTVNSAIYQLEQLGKTSYEISISNDESDFRFEDINVNDIKLSASLGSGDNYISKDNIALLLSGRIDAKTFFKSLGSSHLGSTINLPSGALSFAAKAMGSGNNENTNIGDTLIRSVSLSIFEDISGLDLSKITAEDLQNKVSIDDLVNLFINKLNVSAGKAKSLIANALNFKGENLDSLKTDNFSAWAKGKALAEDNDIRLGLPKGSTESFIKNEPLKKYDTSIVTKKEIAEVSNSLNISEPALKTFIAKKEGAADPKHNKIYFKSYIPSGSAIASAGNNSAIYSYLYHDNAGTHKFESYDEAEKYRLAHASDEIDYLEEIARGLSDSGSAGSVGGKSEIKAQLQSFVNSKNTEAFGQYQQLENSLYKTYGIDRATIKRLFARSGNGESAGSVDFLKILGSRYLAKNVLPQINEDLEIKGGFAALDGNDLMKIMNGEGREVLSKVGAYLADQQMGTRPGTLMRLMETPDHGEQSNLAKRNAFELLGKALGVEGLDFENGFGLPKKFGLGKIEEALSLPKNTFAGHNLEEMLANISPFNLMGSFNLPVGDDLRNLTKDILKNINKSSSAFTQSFSEQVEIINTFRQSSGFEGIDQEIRNQISQLESKLGTMARNTLGDLDLLSTDQNTAKSKLKQKIESQGGTITSDYLLQEMLDGFRSQIGQIESDLKLGPTTLFKALIGQGLNLDQIVVNLSQSILANDSTNSLGLKVANILNVGNKEFDTDDIKNMLRSLRDNVTPDFGFGGGAHSFLTDVNGYLSDLFTSNFDDKAHFDFGTFRQIFHNAGTTLPILIEQGLSTLDSQLGTIEEENNNMKKFANIAVNMVNTVSGSWSDAVGAASDLARVLNDAVVPVAGATTAAAAKADRIIDVAERELREGTKVLREMPVVSGSGLLGAVSTIIGQVEVPAIPDLDNYTNTIKANMSNIFSGDFRPLQLLGAINNIPALIGKECTKKSDNSIATCLAVPGDYSFDLGTIFGSVYGEVMGNVGAEDRTAMQAIQWVAEQTAAGTITEEFAALVAAGEETLDTIFSSTDSSAIMIPGTNELAIPGTQAYNDLRFPIVGALGEFDLAGMSGDLLNKALTIEATVRAAFQDDVYNVFRNIALDCSLFKDNPLLPKGFAASMMQGSPFDRVNTLKDFFGGWFNGEGMPDLTALFGEQANAVAQMFMSEGPLDIAGMADTLGIGLESLTGKLDSLITSKAPTIMGINLGDGIADSLLAFIQTGNLDVSGTGPAQLLKSFKDNFSIDGAIGFISGWADEQLGLPAGSTMAIYQTITGTMSATFMMAGVALTGPLAIVAQIVVAKLQEMLMEFVGKIIGKLTAAIEEKLGLVPGSLQALIMTGFSPIGIIIFVITNLTGTYKTLLVCTGDGYYPSLESPPDDTVWDNGHLGTFDGLKADAREGYNIKAAQYKADRLIKDVLQMAEATGDEELVPVQIMTGRQEDIGPNVEGVEYAVCPKVQSAGVYAGTAICNGWGSRSGLWSNPQTTAWTHIGF